jgi:hypothetical protein
MILVSYIDTYTKHLKHLERNIFSSTERSPFKMSEAMSLTDVSNKISFYYIICCMPIGILLNIFSIYVFSRRNLQKTNMGFLFASKLGIDIVLMLSYIFIFKYCSYIYSSVKPY